MSGFGLVDDVVPEPFGGAHANPDEMAEILRKYLVKTVTELSKIDAEERIQQRIDKFSKMGFYEETE
jgi:acetyl-CoA carboxylase carboxyl transferase subunit alpha